MSKVSKDFCTSISEALRSPANELTSNDFLIIAREHWHKVIAADIESEGRFLFLDTEAIVTLTFGMMYLEDDLDKQTRELLNLIIEHQVNHIDLYLLTKPDIGWVDDGTRDFPEGGWKHFKLIKDILDKIGIKYAIIEGDGRERIQISISSINDIY